MGAGLAILANSRPYESLVLSLPLLAALIWLIRVRPARLAIVMPLILVLGTAAVATGYYFSRFSGNPFRLPYSFYRTNFTVAPHFIWQSPRPEPEFHHRVLRDFYMGWEMDCYADARANRPPHGVFDKAKSYWRFYLGPFLTIPFVTLPWLWRRRRTRLLLLTGVLFSIGLAVEVWNAPHYAAPATGLAMLLVIEALRHLRQAAGAFPVRAIVVACILTPVIGGNGHPTGGADRARILKQLESMAGRHLVLVRYRLNHDVGDEWVYNSAGIDGAPVVWAREMDPASNRDLIRYFRDRRVWLVEPDTTRVVSPYDPSQPPDPPFRFVKLGTQAIQVLRSPDEVKLKILQEVAREYPQPRAFSCDQWNYFFSDVTAVEGPDPSQGCFSLGKPGQAIPFDQWFAWLETQR
jgi:hypothetical protein